LKKEGLKAILKPSLSAGEASFFKKETSFSEKETSFSKREA